MATIERDRERRERLIAIAYFALWELRDLDPAGELPHFRRTRLDLHRQIDGDGDPLEEQVPRSAAILELVR